MIKRCDIFCVSSISCQVSDFLCCIPTFHVLVTWQPDISDILHIISMIQPQIWIDLILGWRGKYFHSFIAHFQGFAGSEVKYSQPHKYFRKNKYFDKQEILLVRGVANLVSFRFRTIWSPVSPHSSLTFLNATQKLINLVKFVTCAIILPALSSATSLIFIHTILDRDYKHKDDREERSTALIMVARYFMYSYHHIILQSLVVSQESCQDQTGLLLCYNGDGQ